MGRLFGFLAAKSRKEPAQTGTRLRFCNVCIASRWAAGFAFNLLQDFRVTEAYPFVRPSARFDMLECETYDCSRAAYRDKVKLQLVLLLLPFFYYYDSHGYLLLSASVLLGL